MSRWRRWQIKRAKPYTPRGIVRMRCIRCNAPARYQWQVCADGGNHRPLCPQCDVALNALVLNWMRHPDPAPLMAAYTAYALPDR